ncbi:MAG: diacylglycerol kinase family lipid kinase [Clostridia bacterium]|nr:diacylglycerol kinase family lipid kinase [Clostridia bacterium]
MLHFIVNTKSGKGKTLKSIHKITDYCAQNAIDYAMHITHHQGHGAQIANDLSKEKDTTIVAIGGDGTFHEVINGIENFENVTVGFIPSGRGNDFARTAGLKKDPIDALKDIIKGEIAYYDYIQVGNTRCLNVAGTGMDVDVLLRVDGSDNKLTYLKSLLACLAKFEPYKVKVTVNGETNSYDCLMVGVCNGGTFGGNMKICPFAKIDDGKLELVIVTVPNGKIAPCIPKFLAGKHIGEYWTIHTQCESVLIESEHPVQLDGEIYKNLTLDCKIVKNGIKTFKIN